MHDIVLLVYRSITTNTETTLALPFVSPILQQQTQHNHHKKTRNDTELTHSTAEATTTLSKEPLYRKEVLHTHKTVRLVATLFSTQY